MKSVFTFLFAACTFALGCYSATEWPHLRASADSVLDPMYGFVEAPSLAEARLAELRALEAEMTAVKHQHESLAAELAATQARERRMAADLDSTCQERDQALQEARRTDERLAAFCQAFRALEPAGAAE